MHTDIVIAYIVMGDIVMANVVLAYINMAHMVMADWYPLQSSVLAPWPKLYSDGMVMV